MKAARPPLPWVALATLSVAIFVAITSEYLPTGLLPQMAEGLGVPESLVGLLVTAFAITVVLTAAPLVTVTRRIDRKWLVLVLLATLAASNLLVAVASDYAVVLGARILGGLANGLFWAVIGAYAVHLVPKENVGRAVAVTGLAATLAFVLGVPVGTALGDLIGWRAAFGAVAIALTLAVVVVWRVLPSVEPTAVVDGPGSKRPRANDRMVVGIAAICAVTVVVVVGQNTAYTYIVPFIRTVAGFPSASVSILLLLYGAAGAAGVILAGLIGSDHPRIVVWVGAVLVVILVALVGIMPGMHWMFIALLGLWAVVIGGLPTVLQTILMRLAPPRLRDVSAAYYATSFNLGVALGALVGGRVIEAWGAAALPFVDAAVTGIVVVMIPLGVVISGVSDVLGRRRNAVYD